MSSPSRVDVVVDPGLPARTLARVLNSTDAGRSEGNYSLTHSRRRIPLQDDGTLDLEKVQKWSRHEEEDFLVLITEIPRRAGKRPKISALHFAERLAIISLPALGWIGVTGKLRRVLFDSLDALAAQEVPVIRRGRMRFGSVHEQHSDTGRSVFIDSPWWRPRRTSLVLGMVRTNAPLKTARKLRTVWAAAIATGAFGVFYSSIWQMADFLPPWRLGLITLFAITAMVMWLVTNNGLWEKSRQLGDLAEAAMYNASTVTTLALSVAVLYVGLLTSIFFATFVVIDAGFMAQVLGTEVSLMNYIDIAWLAASMGTVAGALGSNFDSTDDIRELTQGQRQAHRYREREESRDEAEAAE